jgi:hypothetical protein
MGHHRLRVNARVQLDGMHNRFRIPKHTWPSTLRQIIRWLIGTRFTICSTASAISWPATRHGMSAQPPPAQELRLRQILRRLLVRSFPRLRRIRLTISWGLDDELLCYTVRNGEHLIRVNECLRPAATHVLEGGIAHELCHIDADLRLGRYQRELAWQRYAASRWSRMHEERATEGRVIELGYGPHLLAFVRFARRLGYSFTMEHGLLYPEILRAVQAQQIRYERLANSMSSW